MTKTLGLLTGISYQSGLDYYKKINERYMALMPQKLLMPPNPSLLMMSVDCAEYANMLCEKRWDDVAEYLANGVDRLVPGNVDCLVLCSNTAHLSVPVVRKRHPGLPILHIADVTAKAIRQKGLTKVGLLGTEPTMREDYLKLQLGKHGIETIVPESDEDLHQIFQFIMTELGLGKFLDSTRAFFVAQALKLVARGAQGVIMGCTEIELLLRQQDVPEVPLFASAELHIEAAAQVAAGGMSVEEFMPAVDRTPVLEAHGAAAPHIFSAEDVRRLLPTGKCIEAVEDALRSLSGGQGLMPVRQVVKLPLEKLGILATMPAFLGEHCSVKAITVYPGNSGTAYSSHQGSVLLFSSLDGRLLSISDAHAVTALRTSAASGVATRALANEKPSVLCILGSGAQAAYHVEAMRAVRTITRIQLWGRSPERAKEVAKKIQGVEVVVCETAREAVTDADIVCTLTGATSPILEGSWLKAGAHINAVGACQPSFRELDLETVLRAEVFVDTMDACVVEPGDFVVPLQAGELRREHILAEVGAVLNGTAKGRSSPEAITLFKSVGCALEDLTAARAMLL